jgi:hypothetical protein
MRANPVHLAQVKDLGFLGAAGVEDAGPPPPGPGATPAEREAYRHAVLRAQFDGWEPGPDATMEQVMTIRTALAYNVDCIVLIA